MFSRHVTKDISAYCHGELSNEDSKKFAEHIISCVKCRTKFEEVKLGIKLAEQLPKLSAPDHLWRDVEDALDRQTPPAPVSSPLWSWPVQAAAAAALILVLSVGLLWFSGNPVIPPLRVPQTITLNSSWQVTRLNGTPRIGTERIFNNGRLGIGEWLETDANSRAQIAVGQIGNVEIDENTRVRLVANQPTEHRLELARGKMSARIWAPPRLFFVDTPSAVAADMGCAYTLEVDDHGASLLRVTSGWVELGLKDRASIVPAGAACETRPGLGPGTPYFEDSSTSFREALKKIDFNDDASSRSAALASLLKQARARDTLTLWHLLPRVGGEDRVRVYERMVALVPPHPNISREAVLRLDEKTLAGWRYELESTWISGEKGSSKKTGDAYGNERKRLSEKMKQMMPK